jgi:hypothetical protein
MQTQSFLDHSFAYITLGGALLEPLSHSLAQYTDIITEVAAAPATLESVPGIVYKAHREKWQVQHTHTHTPTHTHTYT